MIWDINQDQNAAHCIQCLAARRVNFKSANFMYAVSFLAPVALSSLSFALLGAASQWTNFLAIFALFYTIVEAIYFDPKISKITRVGAALAEDFDCTLFRIPTNENFRNPSSSATLARASERLSKEEIETLRNWHRAELGDMPREVAALVAQHTTTAYDQSLRRSYLIWLKLGVCLLLLTIIFVAIYEDLKIRESILTFVAPFLPLLVWFSKNIINTQALIVDQEDALKLMDLQWAQIRNRKLGGKS